MSMECDTRLSMMALKQKTQRTVRTPKANPIRYSATAVASVAAFALTLFTRGA